MMGEASHIDFQPRGAGVAMLLFIVGFVGGAGIATVVLFDELSPSRLGSVSAWAQRGLLIVLYGLAGCAVLLYGVFGAHRFRFGPASFRVFTWRGWQRFAWSQVQRASLSTYRGHVELALVVGPRRVVSVPLTSFRRSADLLHFVSERIAMPVSASPAQRGLIAQR